MGFLDRFKSRPPLSFIAKMQGIVLHEATCDVCASGFQWLEGQVVFPVPLSRSRSKPDPRTLDIGGWCPKCRRMICPAHTDYVPLTHPTTKDDWWAPACRDCQAPLGGLSVRESLLNPPRPT